MSTEPFLTNVNATLQAGAFVSAAGSFLVPAEQTLVIETVAIDLQIPANQQVIFARMIVATGARQTSFPIPVQPIGTISPSGVAAETHYSGLHCVRIQTDPGSEVLFTVARNSDLGSPEVICSIAGYLVAARFRGAGFCLRGRDSSRP
jgi:hypothetical protein